MKSHSFASAPAKVILFGEHFVVHGSTAILASIDRRISAKAVWTDDVGTVSILSDLGTDSIPINATQETRALTHPAYTSQLAPLLNSARQIILERCEGHAPGVRINIESDVLPGIGLGSSASSCVASVAAVASLFGPVDRTYVFEHALKAEEVLHGTASGADCYVSTFGGLVTYNRSQGMGRLDANSKLTLIVCNTGVTHSTRQEVERVTKFRERDPATFQTLKTELDALCSAAAGALKRGDDVKVGELMGQNQRLLHTLGVSHPKAEEIIRITASSGALGAKVTGAGGGGAVIALAASRDEAKKIVASVEKAGYEAFVTGVDSRGLVIE